MKKQKFKNGKGIQRIGVSSRRFSMRERKALSALTGIPIAAYTHGLRHGYLNVQRLRISLIDAKKGTAE